MEKTKISRKMKVNNNLIEGIEFDNSKEYITFDIPGHNYNEYTQLYNSADIMTPRIFEEYENKFGTKIIILDYKSNKNVTVGLCTPLPDGNIAYYVRFGCRYEHIKKGGVLSPYDLSIRGIGCLGEGHYSTKEYHKEYTVYSDMLRRCDEKGFSIDPFFLNFQDFCAWSQLSYYEFDNEKMEFISNIFYIDNKLFHPYTSVYVPERIKNILRSTLKIPKEYLKNSESIFEWKVNKENEIRKLAEFYWDIRGGYSIPQFRIIYDVMMNYNIIIKEEILNVISK